MSQPLLLIIEDDDTISLGLKVFFESRGYSVMSAPNGEDGLKIALKQIPDTVILDLRLPDIYGIEILQEIKKVLSRNIRYYYDRVRRSEGSC